MWGLFIFITATTTASSNSRSLHSRAFPPIHFMFSLLGVYFLTLGIYCVGLWICCVERPVERTFVATLSHHNWEVCSHFQHLRLPDTSSNQNNPSFRTLTAITPPPPNTEDLFIPSTLSNFKPPFKLVKLHTSYVRLCPFSAI